MRHNPHSAVCALRSVITWLRKERRRAVPVILLPHSLTHDGPQGCEEQLLSRSGSTPGRDR